MYDSQGKRRKKKWCFSITLRTKTFVPAKSRGTLKNKTKKHLAHPFCDGKHDSNVPVPYVCQLRRTGGYILLSDPSSALTEKQAVWWVSFYRIPGNGSSYVRILLCSFMDSTHGKISYIRLILPMALQMFSLRPVGLPKYNYKKSRIIKTTEERASLQLLT